MIFDCCHSGSGTRSIETNIRAAALDPRDEICLYLDRHIHNDPRNRPAAASDIPAAGHRGLVHSSGFANAGINSHVLLAACSATEPAREDKDGDITRGRFTAALLELFRNTSPDQITYSEVLGRIRRIDGYALPLIGIAPHSRFRHVTVSSPSARADTRIASFSTPRFARVRFGDSMSSSNLTWTINAPSKLEELMASPMEHASLSSLTQRTSLTNQLHAL